MSHAGRVAASIVHRKKERSEESNDPRLEARPLVVRLAPTLLAVGGGLASLALAGSLWLSERLAASADFERDALKLTAAVGRELQVNLEQVRAVAALFESSQLVEPGELRTFVRSSFERYPALRCVLWISKGTEGGSDLRVRLSEGAESPDYLPGSSLANRPELARAVQQATGSRQFTLSAPFARGSGVRVVALEALDDRAGGLGFVCGLYDVEELLARAGAVLGATDLLLRAEDTESGAGPLVDVDLPEGAPQHVEVLHNGGRSWRLSCAPPATFLASRRTWWPWIALVFGLVATGLLVVTVVMASGRLRILRLVEGRTLEVKKAYETLSHEARERMSVQSERRQLEQQLRAIIDLVPDRIFVKDGLGRYLLANQATAEAHGTTVEALTAPRYVDRNSAPLETEPVTGEQRAMQEHRSAILPALPFVDAKGRRRILRQTMIPCEVFGERLRAMLCVATDITEQKQAEDVLRAQNQLLAELARGEDPEHVLARIVHTTEELVPDLRCSVLFLAPDGRHLRHGFAPSLPAEYNSAVDGLEIGPLVGSCGAAAALGERFVVADVMSHPNWEPFRDLARRSGIGACWSQPIRAADGAILGTLALYYSEPRVPEPYEEHFIEAMAYMAGIAIERSRIESRP